MTNQNIKNLFLYIFILILILKNEIYSCTYMTLINNFYCSNNCIANSHSSKVYVNCFRFDSFVKILILHFENLFSILKLYRIFKNGNCHSNKHLTSHRETLVVLLPYNMYGKGSYFYIFNEEAFFIDIFLMKICFIIQTIKVNNKFD